MSNDDDHQPVDRLTRLNAALRRVVLLRETGPKSAAWHRARVQTIWRLHSLLDHEQSLMAQGAAKLQHESDTPAYEERAEQ